MYLAADFEDGDVPRVAAAHVARTLTGVRNDELQALSERQHAVVGRRQVRSLGLTRSAVDHMWNRSSAWSPITPEVVRRVGAPRTDGQRLMAAVLDVGGDATVSHLCANRWWGHLGSSITPVVLMSSSSSRKRTTLAEVHRVTWVADAWTTMLDGIPIVRPEMLALQLFDVCRFERGERLVESLWSRRLLSGPSIHRFVEELGERGRNGTAGLRRYLDERPIGYIPAASGLEARAMQLFAEAMIPMQRQVDLGAEHWTGRVDFLHARLPLVVEIQSERYHTALVDQVADAKRLAQLVADGFTVVELSDDDVWTRPWLVAQETTEAMAALRRAGA